MSGSKVGILTGEFWMWSLEAKGPASPSSHLPQGSLPSEGYHAADGLAEVPGRKGPSSTILIFLLQQAPASGNTGPCTPQKPEHFGQLSTY